MSSLLDGRPVEAAAFVPTESPFLLELSGHSLYKDGVYRGEINAPCTGNEEEKKETQWFIRQN